MKILYFLAHPHSIGGAVKVLMTQAYIMQSRGHYVKVVIQNDEQNLHILEYNKMCQKMNLEYLTAQFPVATCIEEIDIYECLNSVTDIKRIVQDYIPDIIHSVQLNIAVELVARELGISHLMNIYPISKGMFQIEWLDIFPRYHSCDSIYFSKQWKKGLGIESRCIRVAYEKSDIQKKKKKAEYQLINIATFSEYKNQLEIIKFVEYCKVQKIKLHIKFLGDNEGAYGSKCKEYVQTHGLEKEVSFIGFVSDVEEYLSGSDLMIHVSTVESYPGVVVEAMANKVCVMAFPAAGIPELVVDGQNGFLTAGYKSEEIYQVFERYRIYREKGEIEKIVKNAYQTYLDYHSYKQVGNQLETYYTHIIEDNIKRENYGLMKDDIERIWRNFIQNCEKKQISDSSKRKVWYLYYIEKIVKKNNYKTVVIWGAGFYVTEAMEWCSLLELKVLEVIDSYKQGIINGYTINKPCECNINGADVIFISIGNIGGCEEVMGVLEMQGRIRNKNYFLIKNNPCISINKNQIGE